MKAKHCWLFRMVLCLLLVGQCMVLGALAAPPPTTTATAVYLLDAQTGTMLHQKNATDKRFPASTTKIMTALLVLEKCKNLDELVTVTQEDFHDVKADSSKAGFLVGEEVPIIDLLYGLLLPSGNEAANTLARHVGGDGKHFAEMMNQRAGELGCTGTHFVNPSGLHNPNHYTTAQDLAKIAKEAMKNETFALIANTAQKTLHPTNKLAEHGGKPLKVFTTNLLIFSRNDPNYYTYAKGIKTGHTDPAGYCLVSTATKKHASMIAVVLGCPKSAGAKYPPTFAESKALYEWGFSNFETRTLVKKGQTMQEIPIRLSTDTDHIVPQVAQSLDAIVPKDIDLEQIEFVRHLPEDLVAPVHAGQILGTMDVQYQGMLYGTVDLIAMRDVSLSKVLYYSDKLNNFFHSSIFQYSILGCAGCFLLYLLYFVLVVRKRRSYRRAKSRKKYNRYRK